MEGKEIEERKQTLADSLKVRAATLSPGVIDEVCIILVDTSGSMTESIGGMDHRSKIEAVKLAIPQLRPLGVRVLFGLVGFGNEGQVYQQPTSQFSLLLSQVESIFITGQTNMTDGLRKGLELFNGKVAPKKRMILLSDGQANYEVDRIPTILESCRERSVVVDTIAFGISADRARLRMIAEMTGGVFYEAADTKQLEGVYQKLNYSVRYIEHK